ncbi:hypothetical protein HHI36_010068 [Cryptolaemus montrouzieri]|uniref:Tetraspanin n=1 Tax=Cryptolaemus montrouzieri TaxID=559131 RepID=A0ABD2MHK8_9CUCU
MLPNDYDKSEELDKSFVGSLESLSSAIYTWRKNYSSTRPVLVPLCQIGREVHFKIFFIFFIAFLLLSAGSGMIVASIWSMLYKMDYKYIFSYYLNMGYYSVAAGVLCIPCFLAAMCIHYNEKNNVLLPMLIGLLIISIGLLVFGTLIGLKFKEPLKFDKRDGTFTNTVLREDIKEQMLNSLRHTRNNSSDHMRVWNIIQTRLSCCGVISSKDWINASLPNSCCLKVISFKNQMM